MTVAIRRESSWLRAIVLFGLCALAGPAAAQPAPGSTPASPMTIDGGSLDGGSQARAAQFEAFVQKWGSFVQQAYGIDVAVWRERTQPAFFAADAANVGDALQRPSFTAAMAALDGRTHRMREGADGVTVGRLGDVGLDLVYTPIVPCRIVDTRFTTPASPLAANSTRSFRAILADYSAQGGSAAGCGVASQRPGAVVLNVTIVAPDRGGYATVYPFGATQPLTASVNYAANAVVNNSIITQIPDPAAASDFTIYSFGAAHVVVDLVGFYDTPETTPVACVNATQDVALAARTVGTFVPPSCPASYNSVNLLCQTDQGDPLLVELLSTSLSTCDINNRSFVSITVTVGRRCCRVPGR